MGEITRDEFFVEYLKALQRGNAAIFAGAGLSVGSGHLDWKGLLAPLATRISLELEKETDLVQVAQMISAHHDFELRQAIVEEFNTPRVPGEVHGCLARLPIQTYWTTNYDSLIEQALRQEGKRPMVKASEESLSYHANPDGVAVFKMHGSDLDPTHTVITKDDYEEYAKSHGRFLAALNADLVSKRFLFLGFSFSDPNIDFVLGQLRAAGKNPNMRHFAVQKRVPTTEPDYEYKRTRQQLFINYLERYGIKTVLVEDYAEIDEIIEELEHRYYRQRIFVSGACVENEEFVGKLAFNIGRRIIHEGYTIVSGFGLTVGGQVIHGAVAECFKQNESEPGKIEISKRVNLWPFPQEVFASESDRRSFYSNYRRQIMKGVGFVIYLAGNKHQDGVLMESDGMMDEFEIGVELGAYPIAVGATGWAAKRIADAVLRDPDRYCLAGVPVQLLMDLSDESADEAALTEATIKLIKYLTPISRRR